MFLEVKDLIKSYDKNLPVLKKLNFQLQKGEFLSFVGESGAGKSTFLKCLSGLEKIDSGEIILNGKIINNHNTFLPPQQRKISYVFQDYALFPHLNIRDNICFNLDAKYLPVIYGVQRTDSIPIFADTLKTNSAEVYVAYAICEGEIAGLYDIYIDDQGRVCTDDIDNDARSGSSDTVDVVCVGRMDRGDTLPSAPANSIGDAIQSYVENMGDATGAAVGIVPNNFFNDNKRSKRDNTAFV